MEITPFTMYVFTRLDIILAVATIGILVTAIVGGLIFADIKCAQEFNRPKDEAIAKREFKVALAVFVLFTLVAVLLPSKQAAAFIYIVPKVVNNERIQSIADDGLDTLSALVKASNEYVKSLSLPKPDDGVKTDSDEDE